MKFQPTEIESQYLRELSNLIESKGKGIKHSFKEWSKSVYQEKGIETLELSFKLHKNKPSRVHVWIWGDGHLVLDMRTYAKHEGWEFESKLNGMLSVSKFSVFIELIKNISSYWGEEMQSELQVAINGLKSET